MRALVDRHHHGLFYSLQRLFEDRLDVQVFTPVGLEWWTKGIWRFGEGYGDDRLARQFLTLDGWTPISDAPEGFRTFRGSDGHHPERPIYGIEYGAVRATPADWAYIVATVQDNQRGFHRLADEIRAVRQTLISGRKDEPKYVLQVGNTNQDVDWSLDPLALVSSEVPIRGRGVLYHQEFDSDTTFAYREPNTEPVIRSFVNCFPSTPCIRTFQETEALLPEITFTVHGIDGPDGNIETVTEIAQMMADAAFGWHDKVQGDGFGHVIHDWAAIGRPLIGHAGHYRGLMAERFWQDGVTCIDLDRHPPAEVAELVRAILADPDRHREMCRAIRAEFDTIDYAAEAETIREFLA